jgi:hypothetical protein
VEVGMEDTLVVDYLWCGDAVADFEVEIDEEFDFIVETD